MVENKSARIGDGALMVQCFVKLARRTPNMIGAMFRICFPVAEKPMIVKIPPIVGPFNSPPKLCIRDRGDLLILMEKILQIRHRRN